MDSIIPRLKEVIVWATFKHRLLTAFGGKPTIETRPIPKLASPEESQINKLQQR
jgi:hypothetical protein